MKRRCIELNNDLLSILRLGTKPNMLITLMKVFHEIVISVNDGIKKEKKEHKIMTK